jgi:hypothetical protein
MLNSKLANTGTVLGVTVYTLKIRENVNLLLDCSIFVFSLISERGKKCCCVNLKKFTVAMQHIAWLKR